MANETVAAAPERPREHRENRKKNIGRKVDDNQAMSVAKFIRVPPRKARLVMDEIRGMYAADAMAFLRYVPNRAAAYIAKALASAVANAANNHNLNPDNLKLVSGKVDDGPRIKRVRARAQGRAYRILKRMSHLTIIVQEVAPKPKKPKQTRTTGSRAQAAREAKRTVAAPAAPVAPVAEETKPIAAVEETTVAEEAAAIGETTAEATVAETTAPEETTALETAGETPETNQEASEPAEPEAETK
jgi:large subunit ribosomal protein L22